MDKPKFLLAEQSSYRNCNLRCAYCSPSGEKRMLHGGSLGKAWAQEQTINAQVQAQADPVIFKVSGNGEITLLADFDHLFVPGARNVLITNGTRLTPDRIRSLEQYQPDLAIQVTLDGHCWSGNALRVGSPRLHRRVLATLVAATHCGFPVEVNCVLTRANVPGLPAYLDYLSALSSEVGGSSLKLLPFPVRPLRHQSNAELFPRGEDVDLLYRLFHEEYDVFADVLPPRPYLATVLQFLYARRRSAPCHLPEVSLFVGTDGAVNWCGCVGGRSYGRMATGGVERRVACPIEGPAGACATCLTHYEILNCFLEGDATIDDVISLPTFATPAARKYLEEFRSGLTGQRGKWKHQGSEGFG